MRAPSLKNLREKCPWLALGASSFLLTGTIALTLLWPSANRTSQSQDYSIIFLHNRYQSPHRCRDCHPTEFQAWSNTDHAQATIDPIFQVRLQQEQEPKACYACHTTGYDDTTGRFALAGVTCEACHGPYVEGHPDENMSIPAPQELCGTCHARTMAEWATSRHGEADVACTACHETHNPQIHHADLANTPCTDCHRDVPPDTICTHHVQAHVQCIDCHFNCPSDDAQETIRGNTAPIHTFAVKAGTCDDCHPNPPQADAAFH